MTEPKSFDKLKLGDAEVAQFTQSLGDERLLTRDQAAAFLHVSPRTIDYWTQNFRICRRKPRAAKPGRIQPSSERLSSIKLGHKVFFMLGDLRAFRDARKVAA